jgi:hypothetical protein
MARNTPNRKDGKPAMSRVTDRRRSKAFVPFRILLLFCAGTLSTVIVGATSH